MKNYFKSYIKSTLNNFNFSLDRISQTQKDILKLKKIENINLRLKESKLMLNKDKNNPLIYLIIAEALHDLAHQDQFHYLNLYNSKNIEWLEETKLNKLNLEFIWQGNFTGSLGNHFPVESLLYANELNLRNKKNLFLLLSNKPRNSHLFKYFAPYLNVIENKEHIPFFGKLSEVLTLPLGFCVPLKNSCPYLDIASSITQGKFLQSETHNPLFQLLEEDYIQGNKILTELGIPKNSWYVTLHVRETGYRDTKNPSLDLWRNADPNDYIRAIKQITKLGGYVFRMGDKSMTKMPDIPNLIDYAHSKIKSEFMDVFLGATCAFSIGTSSGYYHIPLIFSRPIIFTNSPLFLEYFGLRNRDIYLPRLLKNKKDNSYITFSEFTKPPTSTYASQENYNNSELYIEKNNSEDILNAVNEMIEIVINKKKIILSDYQKKFKEIIKRKKDNY